MRHRSNARLAMFVPAFHDLLKPQWLEVMEQLKLSGGMAVSELSKTLGSGYMTVKQHCEELGKRGYLVRIRVPRTEIGRPEIFYRLSEKAEEMFPAMPAGFSIDLLEHARQLFGETAPEKLLYQYFHDKEQHWRAQVRQGASLLQRAGAFAKLRAKEGLLIRCVEDGISGGILLREHHHPLRSVFEKFPRAVMMEQKAMEEALGVKIVRIQGKRVAGAVPHVDYLLDESALPIAAPALGEA